MRLFIALALPLKTKENLERSSRQFTEFASKGNFVPTDNYHLTLHFLGEVTSNNLIYVQSAMDGVRGMSAPKVAVSQFTAMRGSDVICAKLRYDKNLTDLHERLGEGLERVGFAVEHRAYRPHVTMIRKYGFTLPFSEVVKSVDVYNKPFYVTDVVLYESVTARGGVKYNELYKVSLPISEE